MQAIDRHAWTNRWRSVHPLEKLLFTAALLGMGFVRPDAAGACGALGLALSATWAAGVPGRAFWGVVALPAGFLLAGFPALALSFDPAAPFWLRVTPEGLETALRVSLRALAGVGALAFLVLTTPVTGLLRLLRRLGLPAAVVEIAFLMHRLIFVLLERARAARLAQSARLGYAGPRRSIRSLGLLVGGLFQRALARGRRLDLGLAARGWQGELTVLAAETPLAPARLLRIGSGAALMLTLAALLP